MQRRKPAFTFARAAMPSFQMSQPLTAIRRLWPQESYSVCSLASQRLGMPLNQSEKGNGPRTFLQSGH
jgi:hypothetical protein